MEGGSRLLPGVTVPWGVCQLDAIMPNAELRAATLRR